MLQALKDRLMGRTQTTRTRDVSDLLSTIKRVEDAYKYTPDAVQLEKKDYQPVLIYCNLGAALIKGLSLCKEKDEDGLSYSPYIFTEDRYEVWVSNAITKHPVALKTNAPAAITSIAQKVGYGPVRSARIKGRLYKIRSDCMNYLDFLHKNGVEFQRERVTVYIPYRIYSGSILGLQRLSDEMIEDGKAWVYIGKRDFFEPLLDGGFLFSPLDIKEPIPERDKHRNWRINNQPLKCGPYYFYNPNEDQNK